jgi:hypothetical protein
LLKPVMFVWVVTSWLPISIEHYLWLDHLTESLRKKDYYPFSKVLKCVVILWGNNNTDCGSRYVMADWFFLCNDWCLPACTSSSPSETSLTS